MILSNLNYFHVQALNAIAHVDIFDKFIAVMAGDTEVVIGWLDTYDEENWWEIDLAGNTTHHDSMPKWIVEKQIASRPTPKLDDNWRGHIIDPDDEYMFEQLEEED